MYSDTISFHSSHHYGENYNFLVRGDSLQLILQNPFEAVSGLFVDTVYSVRKGDRIVVADILVLPVDTIDSVWVKVARDQQTFGWLHENDLLPNVSPDDPISIFIDTFSDTHLLVFLALFVVVGSIFIIRKLMKRKAKLVHFNDINSFYPTLLALLVAASAVFYSTIQMVDPDSWRHYYYYPSLNPFAVPLHLGLFLLSVWAILMAAIAAFDDIRHQLSIDEGIVYAAGLMGVCALCYVVFSVSTLYYVGYPLLVAYIVFALWRYFRCHRYRFLCGNCGAELHQKGVCPRCGAIND